MLGYTTWKRTPANAYYDSSLVRRVTENLREMRENEDAEGVSAVLEVCLRSNFAGIESFRLYSETYFGTKDRVREYIAEVERALEYIRKTRDLALEEKARLFRYVTKNNGSTALCLSGGASFGYYHFGVVRAMLDANLLPKVITGTSAGALVAAFVCTHTDDELKRMIIPELQEKITACEEPFHVCFVARHDAQNANAVMPGLGEEDVQDGSEVRHRAMGAKSMFLDARLNDFPGSVRAHWPVCLPVVCASIQLIGGSAAFSTSRSFRTIRIPRPSCSTCTPHQTV